MAAKSSNLAWSQDTHITLLHNTVHRWSKKESDVQIISNEGCTIYTQRILLAFYSELIRQVLDSINPEEKPTISVPFKAITIKKLLSVLATGKAYSPDKGDLVEAAKAAKTLGINFLDWSIPDRIEVITIVKDEPDENFGEIRPRRIRPRHRKFGKRKTRQIRETSSLQHASFSDLLSGKDERPVKAEQVEERETLNESTEDLLEPPTSTSNDDSSLDDLDDVLSKYNLLIAKTQEQPPKTSVNKRTRSATPNRRSKNKLSIKPDPERRSRSRPSLKHDPERKTVECDKCGKTLASKQSLYQHMFSHAGKSFKCDSCDKAYTMKPTLKMHVKKVHSNL